MHEFFLIYERGICIWGGDLYMGREIYIWGGGEQNLVWQEMKVQFETTYTPQRGRSPQPRAARLCRLPKQERPGNKHISDLAPCKGSTVRTLLPLQGVGLLTHLFPGRCPGLWTSAPSGRVGRLRLQVHGIWISFWYTLPMEALPQWVGCSK